MEISEKRMIPLSLENCADFKPRKNAENLNSQNLEIDVHVNEEDEQLLKLRGNPRRKSSTGSTSVSKPEDPSELFSCPSSPRNLSTQDSQQSGIFFGKDRNCTNLVFNFYQNTEEHLQETFPEYKDYIKSKNYITKQEFFKNKDNINKNEENISNILHKNKQINNNNINNNTFQNINRNTNQIKAIPAIIGTFTTNAYNGNRGKFDLPMYYCVGFYQWDSKYI